MNWILSPSLPLTAIWLIGGILLVFKYWRGRRYRTPKNFHR